MEKFTLSNKFRTKTLNRDVTAVDLFIMPQCRMKLYSFLNIILRKYPNMKI